jgi:hypothetical protein
MNFDKMTCFFTICYYFCKEALDILPNQQRWLKNLKIFLLIALTFEILGIIILFILEGEDFSIVGNICKSPFLLILRSGGDIMVFIFTFVGYLITKKLLGYQRNTEFEKVNLASAQ